LFEFRASIIAGDAFHSIGYAFQSQGSAGAFQSTASRSAYGDAFSTGSFNTTNYWQRHNVKGSRELPIFKACEARVKVPAFLVEISGTGDAFQWFDEHGDRSVVHAHDIFQACAQ
jgi:hypothetical protein